MYNYTSGNWGFAFLWALQPSVFPRAFVIALPNAIITYWLAELLQPNPDPDQEKLAFSLWTGFTGVLGFLLYFRSNVAYSRWWEGGTLLQQVRGEWFNAYSSLIAFCSDNPEKQEAVEEFQHLLGRLMSLLFCSALQQVTPKRDSRNFKIFDCRGIAPQSLMFLNESSDKVEVIIQWIQRSTVLNMQAGVISVPPPVVSRVFQELSRGIVNLQNARKIAEFPFPFPYAQTSVVMIAIHWSMCPILCGLMLSKYLAAATAFTVIFFLWCVHFIALQLEMPYGTRPNDLPLDQMQFDWNRSLSTLLMKNAQCPPVFEYNRDVHLDLCVQESDQLGRDPSLVTYWPLVNLLIEQEYGYRSERGDPDQRERHKDLPLDASASRQVSGQLSGRAASSRTNSNSHAPLDGHPPDPAKGPIAKELWPDPASGPLAKEPDLKAFTPPPRSSHTPPPRSSQGTLGKASPPASDPARGLPAQSSAQSSAHSAAHSSAHSSGEGGRTNGLANPRRSVGLDRIMPGGQSQTNSLERRLGRSSSVPTNSDSVMDHTPPWNLDEERRRRGGSPPVLQCNTGCLQAFAKLKPTGSPMGKSLGS